MTAQGKTAFYDQLEGIFRKNNRMNRLVSIFIILFFGLGFIGMLWSEGRLEVVGIMCLVFALAGIGWLIKSTRDGQVDRLPAYQAITKEHNNLIWIYAHNTTTNGATSYNVIIWDKSGKQYTIPTGKFIVQNEVIDQLAEMYPGAMLGYTSEAQESIKQMIKK